MATQNAAVTINILGDSSGVEKAFAQAQSVLSKVPGMIAAANTGQQKLTASTSAASAQIVRQAQQVTNLNKVLAETNAQLQGRGASGLASQIDRLQSASVSNLALLSRSGQGNSETTSSYNPLRRSDSDDGGVVASDLIAAQVAAASAVAASAAGAENQKFALPAFVAGEAAEGLTHAASFTQGSHSAADATASRAVPETLQAPSQVTAPVAIEPIAPRVMQPMLSDRAHQALLGDRVSSIQGSPVTSSFQPLQSLLGDLERQMRLAGPASHLMLPGRNQGLLGDAKPEPMPSLPPGHTWDNWSDVSASYRHVIIANGEIVASGGTVAAAMRRMAEKYDDEKGFKDWKKGQAQVENVPVSGFNHDLFNAEMAKSMPPSIPVPAPSFGPPSIPVPGDGLAVSDELDRKMFPGAYPPAIPPPPAAPMLLTNGEGEDSQLAVQGTQALVVARNELATATEGAVATTADFSASQHEVIDAEFQVVAAGHQAAVATKNYGGDAQQAASATGTATERTWNWRDALTAAGSAAMHGAKDIAEHAKSTYESGKRISEHIEKIREWIAQVFKLGEAEKKESGEHEGFTEKLHEGTKEIIKSILEIFALKEMFDTLRESMTLAGEEQALKNQLTVLTGSGEKAEEKLKFLTKFSDETNLPIEQVESLGAHLTAIGAQSLVTQGGLMMIANAAVRSGTDINTAGDSIGRFFNALKTGQRVQMQARQLMQSGIITSDTARDINKAMERGASDQSIGKMVVSDLQNAKGGVEMYRDSYIGALAGISNEWTKLRIEFATPIIEGITPLLANVRGALEYIAPYAKHVGEEIGGAFTLLKQSWNSGDFGELIADASKYGFAVGINYLIGGAMLFGQAMQSILKTVAGDDFANGFHDLLIGTADSFVGVMMNWLQPFGDQFEAMMNRGTNAFNRGFVKVVSGAFSAVGLTDLASRVSTASSDTPMPETAEGVKAKRIQDRQDSETDALNKQYGIGIDQAGDPNSAPDEYYKKRDAIQADKTDPGSSIGGATSSMFETVGASLVTKSVSELSKPLGDLGQNLLSLKFQKSNVVDEAPLKASLDATTKKIGDYASAHPDKPKDLDQGTTPEVSGELITPSMGKGDSLTSIGGGGGVSYDVQYGILDQARQQVSLLTDIKQEIIGQGKDDKAATFTPDTGFSDAGLGTGGSGPGMGSMATEDILGDYKSYLGRSAGIGGDLKDQNIMGMAPKFDSAPKNFSPNASLAHALDTPAVPSSHGDQNALTASVAPGGTSASINTGADSGQIGILTQMLAVLNQIATNTAAGGKTLTITRA